MKTMLIIAERRNTDQPDADGILWKGFLEVAMQTLPATKGMKPPLENMWQIAVETGLKALPKLLQSAPRAGVRLAIHISDEPLDWSVLP
jgi:hypothetical protein